MVELVAVLLAAVAVFALARVVNGRAGRESVRSAQRRGALTPAGAREGGPGAAGTSAGTASAGRITRDTEAPTRPLAQSQADDRVPRQRLFSTPAGSEAGSASAGVPGNAAGSPGSAIAVADTGAGGQGGTGCGGTDSGRRGPGAAGPDGTGSGTAGNDSRPGPPAPPPGRGRAALFAYGGKVPGGQRIPGPYAALALRVNGFAPMRDRVVEIAVIDVDARGRPDEEPLVTLLEPPGAQPGPAFLHGLESADLRFAPGFADIARLLLERLEGRVVVAHNAPFVEQFLAAEFLAAGLLVPTMPALDVTALARLTLATPNHRLPTLAAHLGLPHHRGGAAIDEARLVAQILPTLLDRHGASLTYPVPPTPRLDVPRGSIRPAPRPRPVNPDTVEPWLAGLMTKVSATATENHDPRVAAYLEALTDVVTRGRIVTAEAGELAQLLARSGYPPAQIRSVLERLLESLRVAAFEDSRRLSTAQLRHLRAVAASVGIPTYFDDLIPPPTPQAPAPGSGSFSRPVRKPLPPPPPPRAARCGHCLRVGHWTANCPLLRRRSGGAISPVSPVDPI